VGITAPFHVAVIPLSLGKKKYFLRFVGITAPFHVAVIPLSLGKNEI
jgi:hypothetical protein